MEQVTQEITIQVPFDIAEAYRQSSIEDREQLSMRIGALLRRNFSPEAGGYEQLKASMNRLAASAERNGLTPEILESILKDE